MQSCTGLPFWERDASLHRSASWPHFPRSTQAQYNSRSKASQTPKSGQTNAGHNIICGQSHAVPTPITGTAPHIFGARLIHRLSLEPHATSFAFNNLPSATQYGPETHQDTISKVAHQVRSNAHIFGAQQTQPTDYANNILPSTTQHGHQNEN